MTDLALAFDILARDKASATLNKVGGEAEKTGGHFSKLGLAAAAGLAAVGAAAVAFGKHSIDAFTDSVSSANGLRRVMGGTIEDASRLTFAAKETGVGTDALTVAFRTLEGHLTATSKATKPVVTGYKYVIEQVPGLVDGHIKYHDALKKVAITAPGVAKSAVNLGFAYKDAHGQVLPMAELLPKIAEKFHDMPDGAAKTTLAVKLFGRAGTQLLPFLNKGAEGLAELSKKSDELGITLSGRDLAAVKQNALAHKEFHAAVEGLSISVGRLLLPMMARVAVATNSVVVPALTGLASFVRRDLTPVFAVVGADLDLFLAGLRGAGGASDAFSRMGVVAANVLASIRTGIASARTALGQFIDGAGGSSKSFDKRDLLDPGTATAAETLGQKARAAFDDVYAAIRDHLLPALESLGRNILTLGGSIASNLLPVVSRLATLLLDMSGTLLPLAAAFVAVNAALNVGQTVVQTVKEAYEAYQGVMLTLTKVKAFFIATTDAETGAVTLSGLAQTRATVTKVADAVATRVSAAATALFTGAQTALTVATNFLTVTVIAGTGAFITSTASKIATTAATVGVTIAAGAARIATAAWTAAQWLLNAALDANPIGLVVIGIAALAAGIIYAWKSSETFRTVVTAAFRAVADTALSAVGAIIGVYEKFFGLLGKLPGVVGAPFRALEGYAHDARTAIDGIKNSIEGLPTRKIITIGIEVNGLNTAQGVAAKLGRLDGARALGGPVAAGGRYLVGERGPEVVTFGHDGYVTPHGASSGVHIEHLVVPPARDPHEAAAAVVLALRMAT